MLLEKKHEVDLVYPFKNAGSITSGLLEGLKMPKSIVALSPMSDCPWIGVVALISSSDDGRMIFLSGILDDKGCLPHVQ